MPNPLAKGSVINEGTKNTGSHFASNVAPGFNNWYIPSPNCLFTTEKPIIVANNAPHPAKLDGKGMEYFRKIVLNCMSSRMRMTVATIVLALFVSFEIDAGAGG